MDATGHLTFALLVVFAIVVGLGNGFFYPAFGGMVPLVVEQPSIASANSLIGVARWSSILVGPALRRRPLPPGRLGRRLRRRRAARFAVSAWFVYLTRPRVIEAAEPEGTFSEIVSGARYVVADPLALGDDRPLRRRADAPARAAEVLMPKLVTTQWHRGIGAYALLTTLMGVGTVTGTLLFGQLQPRRRRGVISYGFWV